MLVAWPARRSYSIEEEIMKKKSFPHIRRPLMASTSMLAIVRDMLQRVIIDNAVERKEQ